MIARLPRASMGRSLNTAALCRGVRLTSTSGPSVRRTAGAPVAPVAPVAAAAATAAAAAACRPSKHGKIELKLPLFVLRFSIAGPAVSSRAAGQHQLQQRQQQQQ